METRTSAKSRGSSLSNAASLRSFHKDRSTRIKEKKYEPVVIETKAHSPRKKSMSLEKTAGAKPIGNQTSPETRKDRKSPRVQSLSNLTKSTTATSPATISRQEERTDKDRELAKKFPQHNPRCAVSHIRAPSKITATEKEGPSNASPLSASKRRYKFCETCSPRSQKRKTKSKIFCSPTSEEGDSKDSKNCHDDSSQKPSPSDSSYSSNGSTHFTLQSKKMSVPKRPFESADSDDISQEAGGCIFPHLGPKKLDRESDLSSLDSSQNRQEIRRMPSLMDESSPGDASSSVSFIRPEGSGQEGRLSHLHQRQCNEKESSGSFHEKKQVSIPRTTDAAIAIQGDGPATYDDENECLKGDESMDIEPKGSLPVEFSLPPYVSPSLSSIQSSRSHKENEPKCTTTLEGHADMNKGVRRSAKKPMEGNEEMPMEYLDGPDESFLLRKMAEMHGDNGSVCSELYEFEGQETISPVPSVIEEEIPLLQSALNAFSQDESFDWRRIMEDDEDEARSCSGRRLRSSSWHRAGADSKMLLLPIPSLREELETPSSSSPAKTGKFGRDSPSEHCQESSATQTPPTHHVKKDRESSSSDTMELFCLSSSFREDESRPSYGKVSKDQSKNRIKGADSHALSRPLSSLPDETDQEPPSVRESADTEIIEKSKNENHRPNHSHTFVLNHPHETARLGMNREVNGAAERKKLCDPLPLSVVSKQKRSDDHKHVAKKSDDRYGQTNRQSKQQTEHCKSKNTVQDGRIVSLPKENEGMCVEAQWQLATSENCDTYEDNEEGADIFDTYQCAPYMDSVVVRHNERAILSTLAEDPEPSLVASLCKQVESLLIESHQQRETIAALRQAHDLRLTPFRDALEDARLWKEDFLRLKQKHDKEQTLVAEIQSQTISALNQAMQKTQTLQMRLEESDREKNFLQQCLQRTERERRSLEKQLKEAKANANSRDRRS